MGAFGRCVGPRTGGQAPHVAVAPAQSPRSSASARTTSSAPLRHQQRRNQTDHPSARQRVVHAVAQEVSGKHHRHQQSGEHEYLRVGQQARRDEHGRAEIDTLTITTIDDVARSLDLS